MTLRIDAPGLWTTVQDRGRAGWQRFGVSVGGPMDDVSHAIANALVGNDRDAATLELTLSGGAFTFERSAIVAICGADLSPAVDGRPLPMRRPVALRAGATVRFGTAARGRYAYLAVRGGLATPVALGSRSASRRGAFPGVLGRPLAAGDALPIGDAVDVADGDPARPPFGRIAPNDAEAPAFAAVRWFVGGEWSEHVDAADGERLVRAMRGPEWDRIDSAARAQVESGMLVCTVRAESDRMGYRLEPSSPIRVADGDMLSEAVTAGTVQVPPGGSPIVLMADRQTTGGYPRWLQVIAADLAKLAQARPGERLRFVTVDPEEAVRALTERERALQRLRDRIDWALRFTSWESQFPKIRRS